MKERLDLLLLSKGLAASLENAKAIILAGEVLVNNEPVDKPATMVDSLVEIRVKSRQLKYVSRAGFKLEKALEEFYIDVTDKVCLDIGASTGGFTDCLLQNDAKKVYAIDVGTNQLDWKLRSDLRVVCRERLNFRYIEPSVFFERIDFVCCDVSFISLDKIIPPLRNIATRGCQGVMLVKPQFEALRSQVDNGRINDRLIHQQVIDKTIALMLNNNFMVKNLSYSPITGNKKANIEFIMQIEAVDASPISLIDNAGVASIVDAAWLSLKE